MILAAVTCASRSAAAQSSSYEQLQTFSSLLNEVRLNYVDSVSTAALVRAAITGMLRSLDPHSHFETRREIERELRWDRGELAGAGLVLDDVEGVPTVTTVYPGSSGERAGILQGDRVRWLNDTLVAGLDISEVQGRLIGERGSKLRLGLARGLRLEPDTFHVTVKFDNLKPHAVSDARMLDGTTAYVRFQEFSVTAGEEVPTAIRQLVRQNHAQRLILDLRGNPGGFMQGAIAVASAFLPQGTLVFKVHLRRGADSEVRTTTNGEFLSLPLIVLVDQGTASAAEALSGALQDHDRALIVGRRTFGKALMQKLFEVPPAGDAVWLTVGYIITPSGRTIQRMYHGINVEQYESFGGRSGTAGDTMAVFRTDHGRPVRGGGGIVPDVPLDSAVFAPSWWGVAIDSSFDFAVADSVAAALPSDQKARSAWIAGRAVWTAAVVQPFLRRVREHLHVAAAVDANVQDAIGERLAARVAEIRWGLEARQELVARNDRGIAVALADFPRLDALLTH